MFNNIIFPLLRTVFFSIFIHSSGGEAGSTGDCRDGSALLLGPGWWWLVLVLVLIVKPLIVGHKSSSIHVDDSIDFLKTYYSR